jgi:hypothetical protein
LLKIKFLIIKHIFQILKLLNPDPRPDPYPNVADPEHCKLSNYFDNGQHPANYIRSFSVVGLRRFNFFICPATRDLISTSRVYSTLATVPFFRAGLV